MQHDNPPGSPDQATNEHLQELSRQLISSVADIEKLFNTEDARTREEKMLALPSITEVLEVRLEALKTEAKKGIPEDMVPTISVGLVRLTERIDVCVRKNAIPNEGTDLRSMEATMESLAKGIILFAQRGNLYGREQHEQNRSIDTTPRGVDGVSAKTSSYERVNRDDNA